jgi:NADH-quinone oxidoreductase subunit A
MLKATMLTHYFPIFIFMMISFGIAIALIVVSKVLAWVTRVQTFEKEKLSTYECGFPEFEDARAKFDVRFYLVAILFIVFDLEVAFLFPWAVVFRELGWTPVIAMGIFLGLLVVGFIYEWKKGALEWE